MRLGLVLPSLKLDSGELWAVTQKRIDVYHEIATQQARHSFRSAQVAAYGGFAFLIAVAVFTALSKHGTAAIAASVVGVAGAGMSAYIGSTFMKAQASSSEQLSAYFLQPVQFARALSAERPYLMLAQKVQDFETLLTTAMSARVLHRPHGYSRTDPRCPQSHSRVP